MRILLIPLMLFTTGCSYMEAQSRLTEQLQKGVQLVRQSHQQRLQTATECYKLQRQHLDAAFDADVRQRANLSPEWVVESRAAYAAALDALVRQQEAAQTANAATARNLDAMDQALQRLSALQSLQLRLFTIDAKQ